MPGPSTKCLSVHISAHKIGNRPGAGAEKGIKGRDEEEKLVQPEGGSMADEGGTSLTPPMNAEAEAKS